MEDLKYDGKMKKVGVMETSTKHLLLKHKNLSFVP